MPNPVATVNATIIARFIAAALISPALTARTGPMRSGPSAPRSASNTSFAKFVPIWIASAPSSAASAGPHAIARVAYAHAVPTATGTTAAGSVRRRAAAIQYFMSGVPRELREIGRTLLEECFLTFTTFVGRVVHERRRAGERHETGLAVAVRVHRELEHAQRRRRVLEHLAAPLDRRRFELGE